MTENENNNTEVNKESGCQECEKIHYSGIKDCKVNKRMIEDNLRRIEEESKKKVIPLKSLF